MNFLCYRTNQNGKYLHRSLWTLYGTSNLGMKLFQLYSGEQTMGVSELFLYSSVLLALFPPLSIPSINESLFSSLF